MQPPLALYSLVVMVLLSGCAVGPRYDNTRTPDATTIVGSSDTPEKPLSEGGTLVKIEKVDEAIAPKPPLYLAPGFHHLTLRLTDYLNNQSIVRTSIVVGQNKSYRVDASKEDQLIIVQIIDMETGETICTERVEGHYTPNAMLSP
jgi:hypothetical protein